jgi:hypothetical protein
MTRIYARVRFNETGEMRTVTALCRRCKVTEPLQHHEYIVSPAGMAHRTSYKDGATDCGIDATRDNWWWPL